MSPTMSENEENIKAEDFSFDLALGTFVYADELFRGGKMKVHKDSDPLIPKRKKENSSKSRQDKSKSGVGMNSKETSSESKSWSSNWKLKDFLLFRNVSGNNNYGTSTGDDICVELSDRRRSNCSRRKDGISAHERHYRKNRAAAEEMRRKTFLPYKITLMGCSNLDPGVHEFNYTLKLF